MANDFDWSVIINLATKGGAQTVQDIDKVEEAVKRLSEANNLNEKQEESANKATAKRAEELKKSTGETERNTESINAQRYALYEVAGAYGAVSASLIAMGAAAVSAFAEMESGFTKVERTSGQYGPDFAPLEADLLALSRSIPTVTSEIQDLAARGAQMGIASENVADFAEVMAKFVATSPEVDVNSVAESFGRLASLTGEGDFLAMASAIAQVGVNSAATDAQIIKTTEGVARATAAFGFSADEIIGLSAAMASLGVQPEAARGIMVQFVNTVDRGAAGITDAMQVMAAQMGIAEEAATSLWKSDPTGFIAELSKALTASGDLTKTLDDMGLVGQRLRPFFAALTNDFRNNAEANTVLAQALADANQGFRERAELDRQFAPIADDLNSKVILMKNAWMELAYTVGLELAPTLKGLSDVLIGVITGITDFINTPVGGFLTRMAVAAGAVVAAYAALRSGIALASAAAIAFRTAMGTAIAPGLLGSLRGLIGLLFGVESGAVRAGGAMYYLRRATLALGRAVVIGAVFQYASEWIFNAGETAVRTGNVLIWLANTATEVASRISAALGVATAVTTSKLRETGQRLTEWGGKQVEAQRKTESFNRELYEMPSALGGFEDSAYDAADSLGGGGLGGALDNVEQKLVSVTDYANDLKSVFDRAFELRFGNQQASDNTAKILLNLRKEADDAQQKIRDLRSEIRTLMADLGVLQSDISTQKYFLSIATEYGDTKRAEAIQANLVKLQAELAKKNDELAKKNGDLTKAQDSTNKSLVGNSEQNIKNRETILELVQSYQAQLVALANSGASQAELARESERLRADFIKQATQLGFNRTELGRYEASLKDLTTIIKQVPRNVSTSMEVKGLNPALAALKEFRNSAESIQKKFPNGINVPLKTSIDTGGAARQARLIELQAQLANAQNQLNRNIQSGADNRASSWLKEVTRLKNLINSGSYAQGGYTGYGGKYEPAGIVHRGEYVIPKEMVNQRTGLPYADALGKLVQGSPANASYARGGYVAPANISRVVDLSASSIQAIARAVPQYIDMNGKIVGRTVSEVYAGETRVGAN